jgi:hypothetical protein
LTVVVVTVVVDVVVVVGGKFGAICRSSDTEVLAVAVCA